MYENEPDTNRKAVLVAVQRSHVEDVEFAESLAELRRLAKTLEFEIAGTCTQRRSTFHAGTYLGSGKLVELTAERSSLEQERRTQRARRRDLARVALVGYTNAGKSTLMRALTGSEAYVADKLFATLDTTVRTLVPETRPRILVADTVGFIKSLPHGLVASFKSTLAEALEASLLAHVVDASDPGFERQLEVTAEVLAEIGAGEVPRLLVFNKIDRIGDEVA